MALYASHPFTQDHLGINGGGRHVLGGTLNNAATCHSTLRTSPRGKILIRGSLWPHGFVSRYYDLSVSGDNEKKIRETIISPTNNPLHCVLLIEV